MRFTPAPGFVSVSSFTFALANESGASNTATARVTVNKRIKTVSLNPFWTYPSGGNSIYLTPILKEIANPGSQPGVNPSGPAVATGIASDGVSRLIIGLKTYSPSTATVSLPAGSPGSLLPLSTAMFVTPGGGLRSLSLSRYWDVPGVHGERVAGVVYVAPETPANATAHMPVVIRIEQDGQVAAMTLDLVPPPVVLLRGIWSPPATWSAWDKLGPTFSTIAKANYSATASLAFDAAAVQSNLKTKIDTTIEATRGNGIVATQVNLVGHGMGGLVGRAFANDDTRRGPGNIWSGTVNAIITIDTPHGGSPLAQRLQDNAQRRIVPNPGAAIDSPSALLLRLSLSELGNPKLVDAFARIRLPISPSVGSQRPGSGSLVRLNRGARQMPYEAVASFDDSVIPSQFELTLNTMLGLAGLPRIDAILGAQNDAMTGLASQQAGARPPQQVRTGLVYANGSASSPIAVLNNAQVVDYVACRLLNGQGCGAAAAADGPAVERIPVDGFSLSGARRVVDNTLTLAGAPAGGLVPNVPTALTLRTPTRTPTHFLALIDDGSSIWFTGDNVDPKIRLAATSLKPITVRVVATFSDHTYATRSWTLKPNTGFTIRALRFEESVIRIQRGASYPLSVTADLNAPAMGGLNVAGSAAYSAKPGSGGIARVSSSGMLTAVAPGTTWVRGSYKGRSATTTIIVAP